MQARVLLLVGAIVLPMADALFGQCVVAPRRNTPPPRDRPAPPKGYRGPGDTVGPKTPVAPRPNAPSPLVPRFGGSPKPGPRTPVGRAPDAPVPSVPLTPSPLSPGAPPPGRPTPTTPRGVALTSLPAQSWDVWWQWNRGMFLQPQKLELKDPQGAAHIAVTTLLAKNLDHDDAHVRRASLHALGRVAGRAAVPQLLERLADPVQTVREDAILALGATGSARAVHALMHIAAYGTRPGSKSRKPIGRYCRPLAVVALGLARRYGCDMDLDTFVCELAAKNKRTRTSKHLHRDLAMAKLLYATLVDCEQMQRVGRELAQNRKTNLDLRSRAIESLAIAPDEASLQTLSRSLGGNQLEARRSAALALGAFTDPMAWTPLRQATDRESEQLTQAFLQISMGRRGGPNARRVLLHNLQKGRRSMRPWSAIGLGLLVRGASRYARHDDVLAALRQAYARERSRLNRGAYMLALGLAKDDASVHRLSLAVNEAKTPQNRAAAGHALALLGRKFARPVVRAHLETDPKHIARGELAEVLGYVGKPEDAAVLIQLLNQAGRTNDLPQIARAIGMLPGGEAYAMMKSIVEARQMPAWFKALAIDALGMMFSKERHRHLEELGQSANFTLFPSWAARVFQLDL